MSDSIEQALDVADALIGKLQALRNYAKVHPCLLGERCCLKAALEALEP